jgi:hypothetical protein
VRDAVPAGSTVLVVSRGDDELIRLGNREGWHFPRHPDGRYAGFHPADSVAAIKHLEELRERGAQYLVFPASARWWLDYYEGFAEHLNSRYTVVADDEWICTIYALRPEFEAKAIKDSVRPSSHLDDYISTLLPEAKVAVVRQADSRVPLRDREVVAFPPIDFRGDTAAALAELEDVEAGGVEFLVVPHASSSWLDEQPGFMSALEQRYRLIASQRHVCTVFELRPPKDVRERVPRARSGGVKAWWRRMLGR